MGRVGCVSKIVYACPCSIFLLHSCPLRRLPVEIQICKKSVGVYVQSRLLRPSTKRLTLNGFTKRGLSMVVVVVSDRENAEQAARRFRPKSLVA
jgi:hypothetical protein